MRDPWTRDDECREKKQDFEFLQRYIGATVHFFNVSHMYSCSRAGLEYDLFLSDRWTNLPETNPSLSPLEPMFKCRNKDANIGRTFLGEGWGGKEGRFNFLLQPSLYHLILSSTTEPLPPLPPQKKKYPVRKDLVPLLHERTFFFPMKTKGTL